MKQAEIDTVKNFTEKMREFGYNVSARVDEKPSHDYKPPKHDTKITLDLFKRTESNDALFWDNLSLSCQLNVPQDGAKSAITQEEFEGLPLDQRDIFQRP